MLTLLSVLGAAVVLAQPPAAPADEAGYLLSSRRWHDEPLVFWAGFLSGLRGFEHFYNPVGNPIYFEPPTNTSELRFLYLHHNFPGGSVLQGGDLRVAAVQARLALTERLSFIATKDGYSWLDAGALPRAEGWNALAAGLKYTFYADPEQNILAAAGIRYMLDSGQSKILQGGVDELSPFISAGKAWGPLQLIGAGTWRAPLDDDDGNHILHWDVHVNYEVIHGLAPLAELRGIHYITDGERTPLPVGGLDYTNLGSTDVSGNNVITLGLGARARLTPHISLGALYEFPLTTRNDDIFGDRITLDLIVRW
jgi:hypothetical protein